MTKPTAQDVVDHIRNKIWWQTQRYQEEVQKQLYLGNGPEISKLKGLHSKICQDFHSYQIVLSAIVKTTVKETEKVTVEEMDKS